MSLVAAAKSIKAVLRSHSARIGFAPACIMPIAEAIKVLVGTMTSSPGSIPQAFKPREIASVPEATPMAYFTPEARAKAVSNSDNA